MIMDSEPAFPVFPDTGHGHASAFRGMTLRDYFAAKALPGYFADGAGYAAKKEAATWAYEMADAMMEARK